MGRSTTNTNTWTPTPNVRTKGSKNTIASGIVDAFEGVGFGGVSGETVDTFENNLQGLGKNDVLAVAEKVQAAELAYQRKLGTIFRGVVRNNTTRG